MHSDTEKLRIPHYCRQREKGRADRAFVKFPGHPRRKLGPYDSASSQREYRRLVAAWLANDGHLPEEADDVSIVELLAAFWRHAQKHYRRPDGSPTQERANFASLIALLKDLFGDLAIADFGPGDLKMLREEMIRRGWSRRYINRQIGRAKMIFKWGCSESLVPADVHVALQTVHGLQAGRTEAKELPPVESVAEDVVRSTLPHLPPVVADMVQVQWLTGMRPGETCLMRPVDLDVSGPVWLYRPRTHKTAHHGRNRVVLIGPKAQAILRAYLADRPVSDHVFKPVNTKRATRDHYDTTSYAQAIRRACNRAFPHPVISKIKRSKRTPDERAKLDAWRKAHRWSPNQLRHARATEVRHAYGLEAAQVVLGHTRADVTQVYAERDLAKAVEVMAKIG